MVLELKKGYTIESNYDKFTDSYITRLLDENGKQVRDALYSADIVDRNYDIQSIKDFFKTYMNDPNFNTSDKEEREEKEDEFAEEISDEDLQSEIESSEEPIEEAFDPEIEKKARKTKRATRKAKLPALSTLSPIIPDPAKGISNFNAMQADGNSGLGSTTGSTSLGEEFLDRDTLIHRLKDMGFKYKFDKYSDKQLYRIYQERTKAAKKKEAEKREQQKASSLADHKKENAKDSYFRDGIEFESEDAAREYFGESMNTFEDTARVRDITTWAFSKDLDLDTAIKVVERQMKKEGSTIPNNLRSIVYACWDDLSADYDNKYFGESMDNKFYLNDMHKAWDMMDPEDEVSIPVTHSNLNESFSGKNTKQFNTITEGLKFFENKCFDETCEDIQLESLFESMRDKLSSDDIKKLGAFMNHAEDADEVVTYMKGLLSEDLDSDKLSTQDLYALANECINVATSNNIWNIDIADVENFGGVAVITFIIKGDWKHDHARFDLIAREFFGENIKFPFDVYEYDADENGDYDSDYYPAYHAVEIQLEESSDEPITLELKESANNSIHITYRKSGYGGFTRDGMDIDLDSYKSKFEDIQGDENAKFAAILLKSSISRSVYSAIVFSNDEDEIKSIAKDWLYKNELSSDQFIEIHYYAMVIDIEAGKEIACGDTWADNESIRKGWKEFSLNESLNEAYVEEWWGQVDEDPGEVAKNYGLNVKTLDKKHDETLYRFEGSRKDIERAMADGYFYGPDVEIKEDVKDIEATTKDLINKLQDAGFILDDSVKSISDNMFGGKHLQVINPGMYFPTSESEGEELTEDEAYDLFRDDLREVEGVLDMFEDEVEGSYFLTYNFGANDKMQITGGIDIRPVKRK